MHRLEHALIVLRDLRRQKLDMIAPGVICVNDDLKALDHIEAAIKEINLALKYLKPPAHDPPPSFITEALRALDWQATKQAYK